MTEFGRILAGLNAAGIRYVVIGGIALARHGLVAGRAAHLTGPLGELDVLPPPRGVTFDDLADLADLETAHGELPDD